MESFWDWLFLLHIILKECILFGTRITKHFSSYHKSLAYKWPKEKKQLIKWLRLNMTKPHNTIINLLVSKLAGR